MVVFLIIAVGIYLSGKGGGEAKIEQSYKIAKQTKKNTGPYILNPKLEGVNKDGQAYTISAERAFSKRGEERLIFLQQIEISLADDTNWIRLTSPQARLDAQDNIVFFEKSYRMNSSQNISLSGEKMTAHIKQGWIKGEDSFALSVPFGIMEANGFHFETRHKHFTFSPNVRLELYNEPSESTENITSGAGILSTDKNAPLILHAPHLRLDMKQYKGEFSQGVRMEQGPLHLMANKMIVQLTPSKTDKDKLILLIFRADGDVELTAKSGQRIMSDWALYEADKERIIMGGKVRMLSGANRLEGASFIIDLKTGASRLQSEAAEAGRQVEGIFVPGS